MAALSSNLANLFPTVVIFGEAGLEASFSLALLELLPCGLVVAPDARLAHTWGCTAGSPKIQMKAPRKQVIILIF